MKIPNNTQSRHTEINSKNKVTKHVLGNFKQKELKIIYGIFEIIYLNFSQIFLNKHLSNLGI